MFKDLALSRDLLDEFQKSSSISQDFEVKVLQYSCWPIMRRAEGDSEIALPPDVSALVEL